MRRLVSLLVVVGVAAVALVAARPLIERAIDHFTLPLEYTAIIRQQAAQKHLDPALVAAVIYSETRFNARTSPTGALGLMQIEPATAEFLAHRSGGIDFSVRDLGTPQVNIAYGSYYLRYLLNLYGGNIVKALAAYNGGETNVDAWVASVGRGKRFTIADIPLKPTRAYVSEVLAKERDYRSTYRSELYG